jgi:hypothetical protein
MAKKPTTEPTPTAPVTPAPAAAAPWPRTVRVARVVDIGGHLYKPGIDHAVDAATHAAMTAAKALADV